MSKKYFLGVGVNFKKSALSEQLHGCENDILHWETMLQRLYGFQKDNCRTVFTSLATKDRVIFELESFVKKLEDDDLGIFVYSGHGTTKKSTDPHEKQDQGFTCFDNSIMDWEIRAILNMKERSKKAKIVLVFDCCYSGTITDSIFPPTPPVNKQFQSKTEILKYVSLTENEIQELNELKEGFDKDKKQTYRNIHFYDFYSEDAKEFYENEILISASGDDRTAIEDQIHYQTRIGILTNYLKIAITQNPNLNYVELFNNTSNLIKRAGHGQIPRFTGTEPFRSNFIFR